MEEKTIFVHMESSREGCSNCRMKIGRSEVLIEEGVEQGRSGEVYIRLRFKKKKLDTRRW